MMLYLEREPDVFTAWRGERIDGVLHPLDIAMLWPPPDLEALGLYAPAEAAPAPDGHRVIATQVHRIDGVVRYVHVTEPTPFPTEADHAAAIQQHLDVQAQAYRYDSIASAVSYVGSAVASWAAEAEALRAWRDAVWVYAYAEMDRALTGQRAPPATVEDFLAELPPFVPPGQD